MNPTFQDAQSRPKIKFVVRKSACKRAKEYKLP